MAHDKMYLTESEARAKGLPSVQEQIDRWNRAVKAQDVKDAEDKFAEAVARSIMFDAFRR